MERHEFWTGSENISSLMRDMREDGYGAIYVQKSRTGEYGTKIALETPDKSITVTKQQLLEKLDRSFDTNTLNELFHQLGL